MINRCCWRALDTWLHHEELRELLQLYFLKASHLDYHISIIYPLILLVVACTQLIYIESYLPLVHVLVSYLACVCTCCAYHLLILSYQVFLCMLACTLCMCVLCLSLLHPLYILIGSCEKLMDYPILREWCSLGIP